MKTLNYLFLFLLIPILTSCDLLEEFDIEEVAGSRVAYYWIMADADTYVECVNAGGGCVPIEANYAGRPLVTATSVLGVKRSYLDFPLPDFPDGTTVQEAYVELYHSGTNEDGKSDDIFIDMTRVRTPWNANDIHYANQPVRTGNGGEFQLDLESNAWSGSSDIGFLMNQEIQNPTSFHGFVASIRGFEPGYEKGYYSNNDNSVINDGLGRAPRLLLKVELPSGVSVNEISFSERHDDVNGSRIFGTQVRQTANWPSDWQVAAYQ